MRILLSIIVLLLAGCAGSAFSYTPIDSSSGNTGYFITTTYGNFDGTIDQARVFLSKKAPQLCSQGHTKQSEKKVPRFTGGGSKNGQVDLVWKIMCR